MNSQEYLEWTRKFWKNGNLDGGLFRELHAALGACSEAGELADLYKKEISSDKIPDMDDVLDEAGDVLYYLARLIDEYGSTLEEVMRRNHAKLEYRYTYGKDKTKEREAQLNV